MAARPSHQRIHAACGIEIEELRPFDASQDFVDSLRPLLSGQRPFLYSGYG